MRLFFILRRFVNKISSFLLNKLLKRTKMKTMHKLNYLVLFLLFLSFKKAQSQTHMLFEIGGSYFTNNVDNPQTRLYDFLALTINPRVLLVQGSNTSLSLDLPMSIRTKNVDDRQTRFGTLLPVMVMFNYGAGSVSGPNKNAVGFTTGAGWGYFYQLTQAEYNETPQYKETLSSSGPIIQAGIRIPHRKRTLFRYKETRVYPVTTIKFGYLANVSQPQNSIGSLSVLIGLGF
jgi:hypothetical protein